MANTKISALTSATTPLAGTEVLPIVQSSTTVKVAVSDLTAGRSISVSGLTNTGLTASKPVFTDASKVLTSTGVVPVANGGTNASAASITAFNNITGYTAAGATGTTSTNLVFSTSPSITTPTLVGDVTLSTGNLVVSNGKGIDFSATPGTGTSELLDDYETGTWTPVAGRGDIGSAGSAITAVYDTQTGKYTKVGNLVTISGVIVITSVSAQGSGNNYISGLPYTPADNSLGAGAVARNDAFTTSVIINTFAWGSARMFFVDNTNSSSAVSVAWKSGRVNFSFSYFV
jgi:hypothetical protein